MSAGTAHLQTYDFDDLLVNLSREVISNGIETENIPATIKDWLCGKIVRALPKELRSVAGLGVS